MQKHARVVVERKLGSNKRQEYTLLAAALDFLPLATTYAAAYIYER